MRIIFLGTLLFCALSFAHMTCPVYTNRRCPSPVEEEHREVYTLPIPRVENRL